MASKKPTVNPKTGSAKIDIGISESDRAKIAAGLSGLLAVFVYAFFRFTWSMRVYSFGAILVGAAPNVEHFDSGAANRQEFADRAGRLMGMAAESFADGLRAYYMAFAVIGWFVSPAAFAIGTLAVLWVLYQREFRSDVLAVLRS